EEDLLAPLAKDEAHAPLRFALVVLPRVVEERDALIDRAMHDPHRLVRLGLRTADVAATETKDRHLFAIAAEGPSGNSAHEPLPATFFPGHSELARASILRSMGGREAAAPRANAIYASPPSSSGFFSIDFETRSSRLILSLKVSEKRTSTTAAPIAGTSQSAFQSTVWR